MTGKIKLSDIKIKDSYTETIPHEEKILECRGHFLSYGEQDRMIIVNHNGELIDGYIQYLVLKELGIEKAEVIVSEKTKNYWHRKSTKKQVVPCYKNLTTTYIFGIHEDWDDKRELMWRVTPKIEMYVYENVLPGDTVLVDTRHGTKPVVVTRIEVFDRCPTNKKVRKFICKV